MLSTHRIGEITAGHVRRLRPAGLPALAYLDEPALVISIPLADHNFDLGRRGALRAPCGRRGRWTGYRSNRREGSSSLAFSAALQSEKLPTLRRQAGEQV